MLNLKKIHHFCVFTLFSLLLYSNTHAEVALPKLISNGMVLQHGQTLSLWGWGAEGEQVTIKLNGHPLSTVTTYKNNWEYTLPEQPAGGPHTLQFIGTNTIELNDIYFGDVWLTSGQSNMDLPMRRVKHTYPNEIANAHLPLVRVFTVPSQYDFNTPHANLSGGQWLAATRKHIEQLSAVSYFFAKALYQTKNIPIGIINSSMGGTTAEGWLSEEALKAFPSHYKKAKLYQDKHYLQQLINTDKQAQATWYNHLNKSDKGSTESPPWHADNYQPVDWQTMTIPGYWADHASFKNADTMNGVVWFKKKIVLPESAANQPAEIWLGTIIDADTVTINGHQVGNTSYQYPPRLYPINKNILRAGENTITVKITSQHGKGGFVLDKPYWLEVNNQRYNLKGEWLFKVGALSSPPPSSAFVSYTAPLGYYNAMLAPLLKTKLKGVVWYQGESNVGRAEEYKKLMAALINSWRKDFKQPELAFVIVQLANFLKAHPEPTESNWAELREAQRQTTINMPNTALVVSIDVGEWNDIHPVRKKEVGERAALAARYLAYNEPTLVHSGPQIRCFKQDSAALTLYFHPTTAGLQAPNNHVHGIQVQYNHGPFQWVQGEIIGNTVVVKHLQQLSRAKSTLTTPTKADVNKKTITKVRYAWADNPSTANLYNTEGLPAVPFETTTGCEK